MLINLLALVEDEGDRQKFVSIYNYYQPIMEKVAMRVLREQKDAEDCVQNAWVQVLKHFEKFQRFLVRNLPSAAFT